MAPDCMIPYDCNATETANIASVAALGVPARCTAPGCADPEACTEGEAAVVAVVATLGIHPLEIKCTEAGGEWERLRHSRSYASLCSAANGTYLFQSTPCGLNADASACSVKGGNASQNIGGWAGPVEYRPRRMLLGIGDLQRHAGHRPTKTAGGHAPACDSDCQKIQKS